MVLHYQKHSKRFSFKTFGTFSEPMILFTCGHWEKIKLQTFIWLSEIFFDTDEWSNQNCVKTFGRTSFCNCVFPLVSDFTGPSQFYTQRYYHFKQICNKIEHFKQGYCKWKMKWVLPAVLISSQLACKSKGSNDNYLKRNPISKLA